jgi:thiamine kinase-like enzyme
MLSPADQAVAASDAELPGLATVLDVDASARLVASVVPDAPSETPMISYTRYKPGASCLTALRYPSAIGDVFITLKALSRNATGKWEKYASHRGALRDESTRVVVRRFPFDGALKGPRWVFDPSRHHEVCQALALPNTSFQVIAYKPERRLVAAALDRAHPVAVIKCYDENAYEHALRAHHALARAAGLRVQSASAWSDRRHTIATPWIAGRVLNIATDDLRHFASAGALLGAVHNAPLDVRHPDTPADAQVGLQRVANDVACWSPESADTLRTALSQLALLVSETEPKYVAIHGDFYAKQLLVGPDGISLLDFDECMIADPHLDLALFAAHVERDVLRGSCTRERADAVVEALLSGYRRSRPFDPRRYAWRTAEALLRLAPHPFRHRDLDWPTLTRRLVQRAASILDTVPRAAHARRTGTAPPASAPSDSWHTLAEDATLHVASALRDPERATRLLVERRGSSVSTDVSVQHTAVMRHKPGRRCLISFDVLVGNAPERWLGKVRARGTDVLGAAIHQQLWKAGTRCVAEPLGTVESLRMTLQRAVPGASLLQALAGGAMPSAAGLAVARSLHTLHHARVSIARTWSLDDELRLLELRASALYAVLPSHATQLTRLYQRLFDTAAPLRARAVQTIVHRDFYHDQVVLDGDHCTLVDLDLVAVGDPALDAGNFVAHLIELHWREELDLDTLLACTGSFADESIRLAPRMLSHDAIARYAMLALGRLIEIAARRPDRASSAPRLIARLTDCLARCGQSPRLTALTGGRTWDAA